MFLCIFQDFDFLKLWYFFENPKYPFDTVFLYITHSKSPFDTVFLYITHSKSSFDTVFLYITYSKSPFDTVLGSLPPPRGLCACLRRFGDLRKKHVPGILEHAFCEFCGFCDFWVILRSPGKIFIIWPIWSNDYASKTRIEILCKKMCFVAHSLFSKPHFLCNSWKTRTVARMSTGIKGRLTCVCGTPAKKDLITWYEG